MSFFWWEKERRVTGASPGRTPTASSPPSTPPLSPFPGGDDTEVSQNSFQESTVSFAWNLGSGWLRKTPPTFLITTYKNLYSWPILSISFQADSVFRLTEQFPRDDFFICLFPSGKEWSRKIRGFIQSEDENTRFSNGQRQTCHGQNWKQLVNCDKPNYKFICTYA